MKRIFLSISLILVAATALAAGSTGAFFTDVQASTGNTFTAGTIDLKIDNHSYYNV
jgi:predicted ribosomally synthesized peptide with SipW-like signal peptide